MTRDEIIDGFSTGRWKSTPEMMRSTGPVREK